MINQHEKLYSGRRGNVRRGVLFVLVVVPLILLWMAWVGIPSFLTERLLAAVNKGDWYCEVSHLTLHLRGGITAHQLRVYPKGVAGPPCFQAERVGVRFVLLEKGLGWGSRIKEVAVIGGVVRPYQRQGGDKKGGGESAAIDVRVQLANVDLMGVAIRRGHARIKLDPEAIAFSDMDFLVGDELNSGTVQGEVVMLNAGGVRGRLVTRVDPRAVQPFLESVGLSLSAVFDRFSFHGEPPALEVKFETPTVNHSLGVTEGIFQASGFAYRGAAIGFANVTWKYERGGGVSRLMLNPVVVVISGRSVTGGVTVDMAQGSVGGEAVSTIELPTLARIIELPPGWLSESWVFGERGRIYGKGVFSYRDRALTSLELSADGDQLRFRRFNVSDITARCLMRGVTNDLVDVRGRVAGGTFTAAVTFVPDDVETNLVRYAVKGEVLHADFHELLDMVNAVTSTGIQGKVYGNMELTGLIGGSSTGLVGRGELNIRQGYLFTIPLFGGLTEVLKSRFSGVDFLVSQREARASFDIKQGRVRTKDARIDGDVFAIGAEGECGLDGRLSFVVQVKPVTERKVIGPTLRMLTYPISKLMELKLDGTIGKPQWKSTTLSWSEWFGGDSKKEEGK